MVSPSVNWLNSQSGKRQHLLHASNGGQPLFPLLTKRTGETDGKDGEESGVQAMQGLP